MAMNSLQADAKSMFMSMILFQLIWFVFNWYISCYLLETFYLMWRITEANANQPLVAKVHNKSVSKHITLPSAIIFSYYAILLLQILFSLYLSHFVFTNLYKVIQPIDISNTIHKVHDEIDHYYIYPWIKKLWFKDLFHYRLCKRMISIGNGRLIIRYQNFSNESFLC